jgi:alpha,alpha-trehalose phosphorylase
MTDPAASRLPKPWCVREIALDLGRIGQMESLFVLSNGHIGLRVNLDEGEPNAIPGTYLGSFYEQRPLPYPEPGYGYPEAGQIIVNVTNGKLILLLADDLPFDIRYGRLVARTNAGPARGSPAAFRGLAVPGGSRVRVW